MPRSMQYCRRSSSRVDGRLVGRDGLAVGVLVVRVGVGVGVGVVRSVFLVAVGLVAVGFRVGRGVGRLLGTTVVCGTSGGVDVVRGTALRPAGPRTPRGRR